MRIRTPILKCLTSLVFDVRVLSQENLPQHVNEGREFPKNPSSLGAYVTAILNLQNFTLLSYTGCGGRQRISRSVRTLLHMYADIRI